MHGLFSDFKLPEPSAPAAKTPPPMQRPPALMVDVDFGADAESPQVPKTPANVRSLERSELHKAVCAGNLQAALALLDEGANVNAQEEHGFTPLHNAAALDKAERVDVDWK